MPELPASLPAHSASGPGGTLRVSIFTPLGPSGRGGIDRQMDALNEVLSRRPGLGVKLAFHVTRGEGPLVFSGVRMLGVAAGVVMRRLTGRIDVAHINLAHSGSVYRKAAIGALCHRLGIPYVIHLHGSRFRQTWDGAKPWLSRTLKDFFERSAQTIVLGQVWADYVARGAPGVAGRIVISPSSSYARPRSAPAEPRAIKNILFLGQLGPRKGVPQLIAALKLLEDDKSWRADLAGDGAVVETKAQLQELGLERRVSVPGWTSGAALERLFESADILVLPSLDENLPMTIVEAFAREVAVISTPVGAIADIVIPEQSGLLVTPGNAEELAAALRRLLADDALRLRLAQGGRKIFSERLDIEGYADRMVRVWRRAAGRG